MNEVEQPILEAMANAIAVTHAQHAHAGPEDTPQPALPFPITVEHRERLITKIERQIETIEARELRHERAKAAAKEAATDLADARTALHTFVKELRDVDEQLDAAKTEPLLMFGNNGDESPRLELATDAALGAKYAEPPAKVGG
jgi:exonuclease VII small subunit